MKYWRILIVLLFPLIVAVATMSGIHSLAASLLTVVTTNGDTTASYVTNTNMLGATLLVAVIASLFLEVTWWTFRPKVAYLGGYLYFWFLSLSVAYILSGVYNAGVGPYWLPFPYHPMILPIFGIALILSILLWLGRKPLIWLLAYLMEDQSGREKSSHKAQVSYAAYAEGYQGGREGETGDQPALQYDAHEGPHISYPCSMEMPGQQ